MLDDPERLIGLSWSAIRRSARERAAADPARAYDRAMEWYGHAAWEVRSAAVAMLGAVAATDDRALRALATRCGDDPAWQVHEALAMAFDDFCAARGYEASIPVMRAWLASPKPSVRRAVSEGLRPWTAAKRTPFAKDPRRAIDLLALLRDDESRSVQESAGNALRDIWRKHPAVVLDAIRAWLREDPASRPRRTIARFALERAIKDDPALQQLYAERPAP